MVRVELCPLCKLRATREALKDIFTNEMWIIRKQIRYILGGDTPGISQPSLGTCTGQGEGGAVRSELAILRTSSSSKVIISRAMLFSGSVPSSQHEATTLSIPVTPNASHQSIHLNPSPAAAQPHRGEGVRRDGGCQAGCIHPSPPMVTPDHPSPFPRLGEMLLSSASSLLLLALDKMPHT